MHRVQKPITNWRFVKAERTGMVESDGKRDRMTCGMVSPVESWKIRNTVTMAGSLVGLTDDDTKGAHATKGESELKQRHEGFAALAEAMVHDFDVRRAPAEFCVSYDETNRPVRDAA